MNCDSCKLSLTLVSHECHIRATHIDQSISKMSDSLFLFHATCIKNLLYSLKKKKKKNGNRVDCQRSEKRSKTHKGLKERFLIGRNRTKRGHFRGSPLFQATYNIKTEKQTIQLIWSELDVGGLRKEKGTRLTYSSL